MPRLLLVHHTPTPAVAELVASLREGIAMVDGVACHSRAALACGAADVLEADGILLAAPAYLGSMAGALKHFFDTVYYPVLEEAVGRPYALMVHGGNDTTGAVKSVERIVTGLRWKPVAAALELVGPPDRAAREACVELAGTLAASLQPSAPANRPWIGRMGEPCRRRATGRGSRRT